MIINSCAPFHRNQINIPEQQQILSQRQVKPFLIFFLSTVRSALFYHSEGVLILFPLWHVSVIKTSLRIKTHASVQRR